jgi:UDP:flavonoid glycosyltransferase YjiC (YdhE family)
MLLAMDVVKLMERHGYDVSMISDDEAEELQTEFEEAAGHHFQTYVNENEAKVASEYAGRFGIEKKEG